MWKIPLIRPDKPFKTTDYAAIVADPAKVDIEKAQSLLETAKKYRNNGFIAEADKIFDLAIQSAKKALNVPRLSSAKKTEINKLIKQIGDEKNQPDAKRAEILMNNANIYNNYGYYVDAKRLYDLALSYAVKSKDQKIVSQIKLEMGRFYYYKTGNTGMAIDSFNGVVSNPGARVEDAINAYKDSRDIESFDFSQVNFVRSFRKTTDGKSSDSILDANLSLNTIWPSTFSKVGGLVIGVTYKSSDYLHTRDISAPFVTQTSIDADPLMPDAMRELRDKRYSILDIKGADSMNVRLNYSMPLFGGLYTSPWRSYELFPVINVGYGLTYTSVDVTTYKNYRFLESISDFQGEATPQELRTIKQTIPVSMELGSFIANADKYAHSWYLTPWVGTDMNLLSANKRGALSFMDGQDGSKPGDLWGRSQKFGIRITTPRYSGIPFFSQPKDDAGRYTINLRYQIDRDSTINSENGIWPVANPSYGKQPRVCSLHMSIDNEMDMLIGTAQEKIDCEDKTPIRVTIPVSLRAGLSDLGAMSNKDITGYYVGASVGVRFRGWEAKLGGSYSTNGKSGVGKYSDATVSLSVGKRF